MKRKFYNGLLLVAMLFMAAGSFVSCKDYDEDAYADLKGQFVDENTRLEELIKTKIDELNGEITDLQGKLKTCQEDYEAWKAVIEEWKGFAEENYVTEQMLKDRLAEFVSFMAASMAEHQRLEGMITTLQGVVADNTAALVAANGKIEELFTINASLDAALAALTARVGALEGAMADNKTAMEGLVRDNEALRGEIDKNRAELEDVINQNIIDLEGKMTAEKAAIEDLIAQKQQELAAAIAAGDTALENKLNGEIASLNATIAELQGALEAAIANFNVSLTNIRNEFSAENVIINERIDNLNTLLNERIDANTVLINDLRNEYTNLSNFVNSINNQLAATTVVANQALADAATAQALAEDNANRIEVLKSEMDAFKKENEEYLKALESGLNGKIDSLKEACEKEHEKLQGQIDAVNEALSDEIKRLSSRIDDLSSEIGSELNEVKTNLATLSGELNTLSKEVDNKLVVLKEELEAKYNAEINNIKQELETKFKSVELEIARIEDELKHIESSVEEVRVLANENLDKANKYTDERVAAAVAELKALGSEISVKLAELKDAYEAADKELLAKIEALQTDLTAVQNRVAKNEQDIATLFNLLETYKDMLNDINDSLNDVDESLKQFITGIILQRAENPVFGSFAYPVNVQSNVLMAYYGYAGSYGVEFPTARPRYYVRADEALSTKDIEMLGVATERLVEDGDAIIGDAGKVYVTVNPSNVNFEGQVLPIVNSIEEESGVKLSPLKYSNKKLSFGATRSAENGLYEADASLDASGLSRVRMRFDLNVGEVKETIKDILTPRDGVNVSRLASTMVDVLNQFNMTLDANALKASWTDSLGVSRSVYSQYNLAATAIKPLSYNTLADLNISSFPGFDRVRNLSGRLIDKISNRIQLVIPDFPVIDLHADKISYLQFDSIKINTSDINLDLTVRYKDTIMTSVEVSIDHFVDIDIDKVIEVGSVDVTVTVPVKGDVKDDHGNIIGSFDTEIKDYVITVPAQDVLVSIQEKVPFTWTGMVPVEVPVDIEIPLDMEEFKKLLAEVDAMEDDINGILAGQQDKVNKIIKTVNDYLDRLGDLTDVEMKLADIDNRIDEQFDIIKDKIIKFLDKAEDKLVSGVNSINKVLQPVMLVKTTDGFHKLSETIYTPTVMTSGDVKFIPTSYNAEIVAPAYKKLVGVTNVYSLDRSKSAQAGDSNCLSALKAANAKAGVAEIIDGDTNIVPFSAKKGYIYEVTYTSVDFSSFVVAKKYYITVK